ncbi:MAG: phosphotransferase [Firmicutes bacterium]|nr:phosphotransferase [Bacillota bacterium]
MTLDLLQILNQQYSISATAIKPFGPIWRVDSAKGCFALKKTGKSTTALSCIFETFVQLKQAGFLALVLPEISLENLPFFRFKNHIYQLFKWQEGYHPSFLDPALIQNSASLFARLHRSSAEFVKPQDCEPPDLIANLEQRATFLEGIFLGLKSQPHLNRIDRTILKWSEYYLTQAQYCLVGLQNVKQPPNYSSLLGFCHNDPAPRNIIIKNGAFFLIDFELSAWGLLITEAAKLTTRVLQANNWQPELFDLVIDAYSQERPLVEWEQRILPYLLCFPSQFWRISSQRWEEKLNWSERRFAAKLWKVTTEEPQRLLFLKSILPGL